MATGHTIKDTVLAFSRTCPHFQELGYSPDKPMRFPLRLAICDCSVLVILQDALRACDTGATDGNFPRIAANCQKSEQVLQATSDGSHHCWREDRCHYFPQFAGTETKYSASLIHRTREGRTVTLISTGTADCRLVQPVTPILSNRSQGWQAVSLEETRFC